MTSPNHAMQLTAPCADSNIAFKDASAYPWNATRLRTSPAQGSPRRQCDFRRAAIPSALVWRTKRNQQCTRIREVSRCEGILRVETSI
jgi:hypothetical protein